MCSVPFTKLTEPVVPLEGTWIEIFVMAKDGLSFKVVPLEGTWIEILTPGHLGTRKTSYPLRVRGLKYDVGVLYTCHFCVVPLEGTWIEIGLYREC